MTTIDVAQLPAQAAKDLQAGKPVKLTRSGKLVATVRAVAARPRHHPRKELAAMREADTGDDWREFAGWPER
jgi:antitoxin (DNA-binding transcriptional repressor) of toxin-antitoxin stability system